MLLQFLVALATAGYATSAVELKQDAFKHVKPGESFTVTCEVSGYSVSDGSYTTDWIRHPPGKPMEWIGDSLGNLKDSLKSKFSISKDEGTSRVSLQAQSLQTEDTALYYCARYRDTVRQCSILLPQ
uniref:Ig-like domain-containing protein n=1 Tax=Astyanax mexicanus TaxID=7994 RepID=A0A8B9JYJ9_ASTMX